MVRLIPEYLRGANTLSRFINLTKCNLCYAVCLKCQNPTVFGKNNWNKVVPKKTCGAKKILKKTTT